MERVTVVSSVTVDGPGPGTWEKLLSTIVVCCVCTTVVEDVVSGGATKLVAMGTSELALEAVGPAPPPTAELPNTL